METLRTLVDRLAPDRVEVLGVAVAALGSVLATVLALQASVGLPGRDSSQVGVAAEVALEVESTPPPVEEVVVHVTGAVVTAGVVTLPAGARVDEAVAAAGGATPAARLGGLNLARVLVDGEQVVVPDADDEVRAGPPPTSALRADGRLDLNLATVAELVDLPGVGEVTAARIVAFRDEQGPFTEAAQLREVRGIGEATWVDVRDRVAVGP